MATEADVPESISVTTEAGDGYVSTGKFDVTVDQCSPLQLKKSEGQEDQHLEPVKCFAEGETALVESKNGVSECGNSLEPLSDPKVGKQVTCVEESFQVDESNQAETGIPDRENGEKGSEEKEAVEATEKKAEQHVESNGIVNAEPAEASRNKTNIDEHVQVISDQQDSVDEIPTGKSFAMVYEEKGPQVTLETKESVEDKLESASVLDDHEEKAGLGKEVQEKNIPDTPLLTQTEDIIEESPKEVKNQYEAVKEDENAECQVEIPCTKREEDTLKKGETLDTGEASVVEEEVLNISTVKCDEGDQGDGTNPTKDDRDVDTFTAKVVEDDDYTSAVTITEMSAKVTPNDEESSPQTLQKCDSGEELQHSQDVMPEETKTETSRENAEEITCTKEETTIQNMQESWDEEKKEATESTNNLKDDNERKEVLETAGTEQESKEQMVGEIHTVAEPPQDFVDKETNEETSTEYQAILELSSPLVVEETAKEIPKDEETDVLILKEEKKEEDAECNEPAEVKSMTREALPKTTEDITEPNKDPDAPISEESNKTFVENISYLDEVSETETEKNIQEKDGLAVSNSDSLSGEVSHVTGLKETETENEEQNENIDTAPEEKGQATILRDETASEVEDIGVQAEENCESKEKLEDYIPTAADEGETLSKEAQAEKEELIKYCDIAAEEKGANILTDETPLEDTDVQAEKNVEPIENLEEQIPIRADESETFLKEAEAGSKDEIKATDVSHEDIDGQGEEVVNSEENLDKQIPTGDCETSLKEADAEKEEQGKSTDIVPEEKGPETILTDATSLDVEDIEVKAKDYVESKENVEEQIPIAADEEKTTYISLEDIDVQAQENFITRENMENPILTTSDEQETGSEETEAEIKPQVKSTDIVHEEKGLETISTAETPLVVEDIGVKSEESFKSKENVEEQIPTAADEREKFLKEAEAENKEQIDEENLNSQESSDKEKEEVTKSSNTTEDDTVREEVLETSSTEKETGEHVVHEIHTSTEPPQDSIDKETNEENSAEHQACTGAVDLSTTAEEKNLEEHAIQELSSPLVVEEATNEIPKEEETYTTLATLLEEEEKEGHATYNEATEEYAAEIEKNIQEKDGATLSNSESVSGEPSHVTILKESETKIEMQDKDIDTVPEERGQATLLANETALEVEDIDEQLKENFESKENQGEQFPMAADEGEIFSKEAEAEKKEQIKNADIAHGDVDVQAEKTVNSEEDIDKQIPPIADEGETSLKEAKAENKEQVTNADIGPKEKGLATILTDETPLEAEDIGAQAEESFESKKKFEEKNPIAADEDETFLKEAEAENKDQIKYGDIAPEDNGLATILTDEKASNIEDISLQAEETFNSCENLKSKIPSTADEHETSLKEAEAVNTEQVKYTDIVPEEKGLANIVTDETSLEVEDIDVKADENFESKETVEEQIPTASHEGGTFLNEDESENKEHTENTDISPEEKGLATISTDEATLDVKDIGVQAERSFESKKDLEEKIPTVADEDETFLKEAETENMEHIKCSDNAPEEKGLRNISTDETSLDVKDTEVKAEESFESNENLEEQIPTAAGEGETRLREAEAETDDQVKNDIAPEEKVPTTISKDEMALDIDEACLQAEANSVTKEFSDEQIPTAADEGEEKIAHGNVVLNDTTGVQILEEAEPNVGVKEEGCKSEDQPEKTNKIVEEVFDESKITGRDFNKEEIVEGNVACFTQEPIEEDTVIKSLENENENKISKEVGSCIESLKEGNGDDLSPEYIREDESETFKDGKKDAVNSGGEILKEPQTDGVDESITCETNTISERSEEIVSTSPVKYEEGEQGESSSLASKEENSDEDTFSIKVAEEGDGDIGAVGDIETSANVNGEEGLPRDVQKSEPVKGYEKLLDVMPEESKAESTSENAEVVTCTKEEIKIQNIQESLDEEKKEEERTPMSDTKENETEVEEEQVVDEPKSTDGDFSEGQPTEGNAAICTLEIIQEETAENSQDSDKETENLKEEGSSIESIKACNTDDPSQEFIPEDGSKKFDDNKQDTVKFEGEILKEPEIAGVGESTTYETNQIVETSKEIFDASSVKYEEGQPGEGSCNDSAKASKEEDVTEDDDNNGAVSVTESSAEATSKGEEDSAQASEKYEQEEKVPVKISDVADAKEICDLEDKSSFAEKTTEETSLQKEGHAEVSELAPEKLNVDPTEEEFKEGSEIVPESESRSIDVVLNDEIVTSQTLDKGILQEQVEIPSSTLLTEEKEIEASQHEHETPTQDKNIEDEQGNEVPADENAGELSAVRSEDETSLQKEESKELKASELALEKLDAGDTEEIKETFKTISKSDSQSTDAVSKDEIVADKTHLEASYVSLPKEEELKTYQDDLETTTQEKSIEEEYAKETEVPADENGRDLVAATLVEETLLQKEEARELKVSELGPENLDAGETEEEIKESFEKVCKSDSQRAEVVSGDEMTAYQTLHEGTSNEQFHLPSLAPEEPNAGETEEEIKKTPETVSEPDSPSTDVVSRDEAISDQTLHEGISTEKLQIPSSILLPEEKDIKASEEHGTTFCDKNIEEKASNLQMQVDENANATRTEEETSLIKEEPRELKASDFEIQLKEEVPRESSNEEITKDEKLPEESEPDSVREESHPENKAKAEKRGEQIDETSKIKTNELSEVDEKGIASVKFERQLTFEGLGIKENDPCFIEDKKTADGFTEEEKRVEEAAFEFGQINQGDEINSKNSITATQMEKDSSTEVSCEAQNHFPIVETSQGIESNECGKVKSTESGTVSLPNLVQESTKESATKEAATASKELKTEEDEEEEHEHSEQLKTDEEKGENEHKNEEPGYESPIMVEASRDSDVNVKVISHKKSSNILSGIKHSMSKVKKAIIGKSSHPKTHSEK